jgi:hypothetical protein
MQDLPPSRANRCAGVEPCRQRVVRPKGFQAHIVTDRVMACSGNDHLNATDRGQRNGGDIGVIELGVVLILPDRLVAKTLSISLPVSQRTRSKSWTWRSRNSPEPGMKSLWLGCDPRGHAHRVERADASRLDDVIHTTNGSRRNDAGNQSAGQSRCSLPTQSRRRCPAG